MDLSNLKPALNRKEESVDIPKTDADLDIPLVEDAKDDGSKTPSEIKSRVITDKDEIAKIEAAKNIKNIMIDAVTRQTAQIRLEACENDVTIESVYNIRLEALMVNDKLDERGFNIAKSVLDSSFEVAKSMGVPDKSDTDTIFLLAKAATGEINMREQIESARLMAHKKKLSVYISEKEKTKRRKKAKTSKQARKKQRK